MNRNTVIGLAVALCGVLVYLLMRENPDTPPTSEFAAPLPHEEITTVLEEEIASTSFAISEPAAPVVASLGSSEHRMLVSTEEFNERNSVLAQILWSDHTPAAKEALSVFGDNDQYMRISTDDLGFLRLPLWNDTDPTLPFDLHTAEMTGTPQPVLEDGVIIIRLPYKRGTLHGRVMSATEQNVPLTDTEVIFRADFPGGTHSTINFENGWHAGTIRLSSLQMIQQLTTDALGMFAIEDFRIPRYTSVGKMDVAHPPPIAWDLNMAGARWHVIGLNQNSSDPDRIHDFLLPRLFDMEGSIHSSETGEPMTNFRLWASRTLVETEDDVAVITDSEGNFRIENIPIVSSTGLNGVDDVFYLMLRDTPFVWTKNGTPTTPCYVTLDSGDRWDFQVKSANLVTLQCLEPDGGPLPGVALLAHLSDETRNANQPPWLGTSDADGMLQMGKPNWPGEIVIQGDSPFWNLIVSDPVNLETASLVTVQALDQQDVEVLVVDGEGVPQREVRAWGQTTRTSYDGRALYTDGGRTARDGIILLKDFPLTEATFSARNSARFTATETVDLRNAEPGDRITLVLEEPERVLVQGQVTDLFCTPIAGATVMSQWEPSTDPETGESHLTPLTAVATDEGGHFEIEAPVRNDNGEIILGFSAEGYQDTVGDVSAEGTNRVSLSPTLLVRGQVTGADLSEYDEVWLSISGFHPLNDDGAFQAEVNNLFFFGDSTEIPCLDRESLSNKRSLIISLGDELSAIRELDISHEPGAVIDLGLIEMSENVPTWVRVRDNSGDPIEGALVHIRSNGERHSETWPTDATGMTSAISTAQGPALLVVSHDDYVWYEESIEISESEIIEVTLDPRAHRTIDVQVFNSDGHPAPNATGDVHMRFGTVFLDYRSFVYRTEHADAQGRIHLTDIPDGDVRLSIIQPEFGNQASAVAEFTFGEGEAELTSFTDSITLPERVSIEVQLTGGVFSVAHRGQLRKPHREENGVRWAYQSAVNFNDEGWARLQVPLGEQMAHIYRIMGTGLQAPVNVTTSGQAITLDLSTMERAPE